MRRLCASILLLILLAAPLIASAETAVLVLTTDADVQSVFLMDNEGRSVSTVLKSVMKNNSINWTLQITRSGAESATVFELDANGNWLRTDMSYDMSMFFPESEPNVKPFVTAEPLALWPADPFGKYRVNVIPLPDDERYQTRCGPGRNYGETGAFLTGKITSTKALFIENGYVYIDLRYKTVGDRRVYFKENAFYSLRNVPEVVFHEYPAICLSNLTPRYGPGKSYDLYKDADIETGTELTVFFEENRWVFAEFDCELGCVRGWIPADQVEAR